MAARGIKATMCYMYASRLWCVRRLVPLMLRADASGRVPFALVAVLILMSAGLCAMYAAKLAREQDADRAQEAPLAALRRVADDGDGVVLVQAQHLAVAAVGGGS